MFRPLFEVDELGNLGVGAFEFFANDQLRVAVWKFSDQLLNNIADRVCGIGHAEKVLQVSAVILLEPTPQRFLRRGVATFERFQKGHRRRKIRIGSAPMEGKFSGGKPLPQPEHEAQACEGRKNCVNEIHRHEENSKSGLFARNFIFRMFVEDQHTVWRQIVVAGEGVAGEEIVHRLVKLDSHRRILVVQQEENP